MIDIRRIQTNVEQIFHEFGPPASTPLVRGAIGAVLTNPFSGRYVADLLPMMEALKPLGLDLARQLIDALGVEPTQIESYGKGAIVGAAGELEHGALWHVPGGYAMRQILEKQHGLSTNAIVSSCKKVGAPSCRLDIPITHINASYVRSHYDAMEVSISGAPREDELVVFLVMTTGARVHARVGGLAKQDVVGVDGLR
jgi:hypothetical protein